MSQDFNMVIQNTCLVCGNKDEFKLKWRGKKHHPTYYRCENCGLIFAYPQNDNRNFQDVPIIRVTKDDYNTRIRNFELRYKKIEKYLSNKLPKVLDIGCGDGIFLNYMKKKGCKVSGIEALTEYVRYGKETFGVNVVNGFFENQNIKQKFNLITMFNVLEHTKNPRAVLIKSRNLLEGNGLLVLEIPYIFTLQSIFSFGYWHHFQKTHNWFFNKKNISSLLKEAGFEAISISFIPKVVPLPTISDRLLSNTVYMHIKRNSYLRFRRSAFYQFLNKIEINVNIMDYLLIIAKRVFESQLIVGAINSI